MAVSVYAPGPQSTNENARGIMLTKRSKYFLSLAAATPLLFAAACTDNNIFGPQNIAGTYQLTIYGGATLPVTITVNPGQDSDLPNGGTWRITDGNMTLRSDGTFTETNIITKTPFNGSSFRSDFISDGDFDLNGNSIQFSAPAQGNFPSRFFSGTIDEIDGRLTYTEDGFNFEYRR
jgi:hypothetical protein